MWKNLMLVVFVGWGGYTWWTTRAISHGPGIVAPDVPMQGEVAQVRSFDYKGYRITPLARFDARVRVLSREDYRLGREADISPTDLALGWGRMSDETVLSNINIRQSNRFFYWSVREFPIPQRELEISAANMHLIPADSTIERQLKRVRKGNVVHVRGYLVRVDGTDGWHWVSSLTREDTGNGACEVVWVETLSVM